MKKGLSFVIILFTSLFLIGACSDNTDRAKEDTNDEVKDELPTDETKDVEKNGTGHFTPETEDQIDLGIGDTGRFDSDLTTYEVTLDNVELIEGELDGLSSQLDKFILLDITVKNTGEDTQTVQDLMYGLEVTDNLDHTGHQNYAEDFDSVDVMSVELNPGEEVSGQYITETYESDTYYFRLRTGIAGSGSSNQVTWIIPVDEVN